MTPTRVLAFDVGGSVFDWKGAVVPAFARALSRAASEGDAEQLAMLWRREMFVVLQKVHTGEIAHCGMDHVLDVALTNVLTPYPALVHDPVSRDELHRAWHRMKCWDEFPEALKRFRRKYSVMILSVLSFAMLVDSSKASGLDWDAIVSCETLSAYKINPRAYTEGAALMGVLPQEVCLVAVHPVDLKAAASVGMKTAYVAPKAAEPDILNITLPFDPADYDYVAQTYAELCDVLGC